MTRAMQEIELVQWRAGKWAAPGDIPKTIPVFSASPEEPVREVQDFGPVLELPVRKEPAAYFWSEDADVIDTTGFYERRVYLKRWLRVRRGREQPRDLVLYGERHPGERQGVKCPACEAMVPRIAAYFGLPTS